MSPFHLCGPILTGHFPKRYTVLSIKNRRLNNYYCTRFPVQIFIKLHYLLQLIISAKSIRSHPTEVSCNIIHISHDLAYPWFIAVWRQDSYQSENTHEREHLPHVYILSVWNITMAMRIWRNPSKVSPFLSLFLQVYICESHRLHVTIIKYRPRVQLARLNNSKHVQTSTQNSSSCSNIPTLRSKPWTRGFKKYMYIARFQNLIVTDAREHSCYTTPATKSMIPSRHQQPRVKRRQNRSGHCYYSSDGVFYSKAKPSVWGIPVL